MNHYVHTNSNGGRPATGGTASTTTIGTASLGPGVAVLRGRGPPNVKVKRKCIDIICEPCFIFLMTTILVTALATALLSVALTSRYWEMMIYDQEKLRQLVENRTHVSVQWLFDGRVPRITGTTGGVSTTVRSAPTSPSAYLNKFDKVPLVNNHLQSGQSAKGPAQINVRKKSPEASTSKQSEAENYSFSTHPDANVDGDDNDNNSNNNQFVFLLPLHSGVWISCIDITEQEFEQLQTLGYDNDVHCVDHLNPDLPKPTEPRASWQHRMQNLAIACALVCLILLGAAIVVGLFGILRRQISAVLVTGVIYVLAALFALFTLTIVHLKHKNRHECDPLDVWTRLTPDYREFRSARIISHGWSLQLGWAGSVVCVLASIMWILLSKILRYNPISLLP